MNYRISLVPRVLSPFLLMVCQPSSAQQRVNESSLVLADFQKLVQDYAKLHNTLESAMPALRTTPSPEKIRHHEHELAEQIRKARKGAVQGDIFTTPIAEEFRRLIGIAMQGQDKTRVQTSLKRSEPQQFHLKVNDRYPPGAPVQSAPPSLLLNLPPLPKELHYCLLGRDLVLRDTKANLIVDVLPKALP